MSRATDKHAAKKRARTLAAKVFRGGHKSREDLEYTCGLTREETERVYQYLVRAERAPEYTHYSDESGGDWCVPVSEKSIAEILLKS